ncbi:MAG: hypothetical protein DIZ80_03110 [endosymbiont of Galathealinum brachiosum]|uniref:Uncharacterized protein n=1 Tax=endosymbiont of Galathealinum brachiosum TaxID=2200906 RepID=A0A370DI03_9GAMM|nr:MAG: hypothetical protein DIZ80_03110 [endosymbiont of Galathealinum brachiosum]
MSYRKAINDKCKDCIFDPSNKHGTWRQQVYLCTVSSCPLWPIRPHPSTQNAIIQADEYAKTVFLSDEKISNDLKQMHS